MESSKRLVIGTCCLLIFAHLIEEALVTGVISAGQYVVELHAKRDAQGK
jgi:hypothetical protein